MSVTPVPENLKCMAKKSKHIKRKNGCSQNFLSTRAPELRFQTQTALHSNLVRSFRDKTHAPSSKHPRFPCFYRTGSGGTGWLLTPTVQEKVSRDLLHIHSVQWDNTSAHWFLSYQETSFQTLVDQLSRHLWLDVLWLYLLIWHVWRG